MRKYLETMVKSEEGYGTVEMLLIIAGIGLLATALFKGLTTSLVGDGTLLEDDSTTAGKVVNGINGLVEEWVGGDGE